MNWPPWRHASSPDRGRQRDRRLAGSPFGSAAKATGGAERGIRAHQRAPGIMRGAVQQRHRECENPSSSQALRSRNACDDVQPMVCAAAGSVPCRSRLPPGTADGAGNPSLNRMLRLEGGFFMRMLHAPSRNASLWIVGLTADDCSALTGRPGQGGGPALGGASSAAE